MSTYRNTNPRVHELGDFKSMSDPSKGTGRANSAGKSPAATAELEAAKPVPRPG
jgi:hypothetical protein